MIVTIVNVVMTIIVVIGYLILFITEPDKKNFFRDFAIGFALVASSLTFIAFNNTPYFWEDFYYWYFWN